MRDHTFFDTTFSGCAITNHFPNFTNEHQYIPGKNQQLVRHTSCYFVSPVLKNTTKTRQNERERGMFVSVCGMLASSNIDSDVSD